MTFLLDTHVVVQLLTGDRARVPRAVADAIAEPAARAFVSAVSVWEIAIKRSRGKLEIGAQWYSALMRLDLEHLPVTAEHASGVERLPWRHRDPFDRLLVAQARVERATLVTADGTLAAYEVDTWWGE